MSKGNSPAPGLEKGLLILEYVEGKGRAGFTELGRELGINKASLSRFLGVLTDREYLVKAEGAYMPGKRGGGLEISRSWDSLIFPLLSRLSRELDCSVMWVEFHRGRMHFVERVIRDNGVNMREPGSRGTNYLVNPAGYILLGSESPINRKSLLEGAEYTPEQRVNIPPGDVAEKWIDLVTGEGFFDDRGQIFPGIRRCALPLSRRGHLIGALVLGMIDGVVDDSSVNEKMEIARRTLESSRFSV